MALLALMVPTPGCFEDGEAGESSPAEQAEEQTEEQAEEKAGPAAGGGAGEGIRPPLSISNVPAAPADRPAVPAPPAGGPTELSPWRLSYLETSARQARRLERAIKTLGESRLGSAALAASALAASGRDDWRPQAAAWARQALERCGGRWHKLDCEVGMLSLQRVVLQFPDALPPPLLERLRAAASETAPPPGPDLIRDPWSFRRTENQQMAVMARSLVAHRVAGSGDSAAGRAWAAHARAFLRAHDRQGWYEGESNGYMATSITALLLLRDHAADPRVRGLAQRQLHLLFTAWAENQVGGTPAGPRSRTYTHWAQGTRNTPWLAWAYYATGGGSAGEGPVVGSDRNLGDWPDIATAGYAPPAPVAQLLRSARQGPPYEIRTAKTIDMGHRKDLAGATYSWVTPDYVLGTAPAVEGMALSVSGGQEIQATLFPQAATFSPLYLWTRVRAGRASGQRWRSRAGQEQAVGWRHLALARMGSAAEPGHAWLASPWSRPEPAGTAPSPDAAPAGDVLVSRSGDTWVALVTEGGWELARASAKFPDHYGDKAFQGSWVAVPRRQPAVIAMQVGRAGEEGSWQAWKEKAAGLTVAVAEGGEGAVAGRRRNAPPALVFQAAPAGRAPADAPGHRLIFRPGVSASIDGEAITPSAWPLHQSPHLIRAEDGGWGFAAAGAHYRFPPLPAEEASPVSPPGG